MKTKTLGELFSDALDKAWGHFPLWDGRSLKAKRAHQKAAKLFLALCGSTPGMLAPALAQVLANVSYATELSKAQRSKRTSKAANRRKGR